MIRDDTHLQFLQLTVLQFSENKSLGVIDQSLWHKTAHVKQYLLTSNRKVVKHTFACKSIGAQVFSVVSFLLVLIEIKVKHLCVTFLLDTYSLQVKPVKHAGWQQAFR